MARHSTVSLDRSPSTVRRAALSLMLLCAALTFAAPARAQSSPVPTQLRITIGTNALTLYWQPAANAASYNVYRGTSAGGESVTPIATGVTDYNGNADQYTDSTAVSGTTYYYKVTAVSLSGESGYSNEASGTPGATALPAPILAGTPGAGQAVLDWSAISGANHYDLYRSIGAGNATYFAYVQNITSTTFTDTLLTDGTPYNYYVDAVNANGSGTVSNKITVIPGETTLPAPTGVHVYTSGTALSVNWNSVPGATGYNIYRGLSRNGEGSAPYAIAATGTSNNGYNVYFNDTSVTAGTTYDYFVTAKNGVGESGHSSEASGLLNASTSAPPVLTASASASPVKIVLVWSAVTGATSYDVFREIAGTGDFIDYASTTAATYTDTSVSIGVSYTYVVDDNVGEHDQSGTGSATSNAVTISPGGFVLPAPTGLAASPSGASAVALSWNPVPDAATYNVYRGTASGAEGATPIAVGITAASDTDSTTTAGTKDYYVVTAVTTSGESAKSNEASATAGSVALAAPVLTAVLNASGQPVLTWSAVTGAASYAIYRNAAAQGFVQTAVVTTTSDTDTSVSSGVNDVYYVCAVGANGQGPGSNQVAVTPGQAPPPAPLGLTASSASATQVKLTWTAVPGAASYNVYKGTASGSEGGTPIALGVTSPISFVVAGLTSGTRYYFQVTAVTGGGESGKSNEASATPGSAILAAPHLIASSPSSTEIDLKWNSIGGTTGYAVYRSVGAAGSYLFLTTATTNSTKDTGLTTGLAYAYYVVPIGQDGAGSASNAVSVALGSAVPPAPTFTYAYPYGTSDARIYVAWSAVPGATSYNVYRGTSPGSEGSTPIATGVGTSYGGSYSSYDYYLDSTTVAGTTYYYKVTAVNAYGESVKSVEGTATSESARLAAPVLTGTSSSTSITLRWSAVTGATSYAVRREDPTGQYLTLATTTATSYTDSAAAPGVAYNDYVYADSALGSGANSNVVSISVNQKALAAPTGLTASPSNGGAHLDWNPVPGASSYNVYVGTSAGGEGTSPARVGVAGPSYTSNYALTGLTNGTTYYFEVTAVGVGGESGKSNEASAVPNGALLSAPTLTVSPASGQATLTWSAVTGATSYLVFRAVGGSINPAVFIKSVTGTTTTDTGLTNGLSYTYQVIPAGVNGHGSGSNAVTVLIDGVVPPAPAGLIALQFGSYIQLQWNPVPGVTKYNVYRSTTHGGEGSTPFVTNTGTASGAIYDYNDSAVTAGQTYFYQVTAVNAVGESAKSNEASAADGTSTLGAPKLSVIPSSGKAVLTWSSVPGATGYTILENVAGAGYVFLTNTTATTYTMSSLTNGVPYGFQVYAYSAAGLERSGSNAVTIVPGGASLAAPTGLTVTNDSSANLQLSWNVSLGASSYDVYRATQSGGEGSVPYATGLTVASYNDAGVYPGTTYYYQVSAVNTYGESGKSNEAGAQDAGAVPAAPILTASAGGTSVVLTWSMVTGATSYHVFRNVAGAGFLYLTSTTSVTYTDSGLTNGLPYSYYVCAVGIGGQSANSNTATATVGGTALPAPFGVHVFPASNYLVVEWNTVPGAASYNVYRGTSAGGEGATPYHVGYTSSDNDGQLRYFDDTNVISGTTYYYFVTATNGIGESAKSNEASGTYGVSLLPAPSLSAISGSGQVGLHWSSVAGATSYEIYRSIGATGNYSLYQSVTGTAYTDTGVTNGELIAYWVFPVNVNNRGTGSNVVSLYVDDSALSAPTGAYAYIDSSNDPHVVWNGVAGASSYNVYRGTAAGGEGSAPIATGITTQEDGPARYYFRDTTAQSGTTYYYKVTAVNAVDESAKSNEASVEIGAASLPAPYLTGASGTGKISLTWTAVSGATSYILFREDQTGHYSVLKIQSGTAYTDSAVQAGITYSYIVYPESASGVSSASPSNTVTIGTSGSVLGVPQGVEAYPNGGNVNVAWNVVPGATSYNVYRGTTAGGETAPPIATGGYTLNGRGRYYWTDSNVATGQVYFYYITAINSYGESGKSTEVSAQQGASPLSALVLTAVSGSGTAALSWDAIPGAIGYRVFRTDPTGYFSVIYTGSATSYTDGKLTNGLSYTYFAGAYNALGSAPASNTVTITPGAAGGNPLPAPDLVATAGDNSVTLSWTSVPNASSYTLYRSTASGSETPIKSGITPSSGAITSYTDTTTVNYTAYYYKVAAASVYGTGLPSNEATATPPTTDTGDFLLTAIPSVIAIAADDEDAVTIGVNLYNNLSDVTLTVSGLPANVTAVFDPSVADASGSYLNLYAGTSASPGVYTLTVTGTAGGHTHTIIVTLQVLAAGSMLATRSLTHALWDKRGDTHPVFSRRASLLDDVGHLVDHVSAAEVRSWTRDLHLGRMGVLDAARRQLWLGEYALAHDEQPGPARTHFANVGKLAKRLVGHGHDGVLGVAAQARFDSALALFDAGAYAEARDAFHAILMTKTPMPGIDRPTVSLWWRHGVACAGYHASRSALGIPEPPRLDPKCGVAALATCLRGLGLPYDEPRLLASCRVTGEGSTLADLETAAPKLGVTLRAFDADDAGLILLPKPVVAFIEHDHFIAVTNADASGVSYLCSDCGAWPGGSIHLSWKQWHMVEATRYAVATVPGSAWDRKIERMEALQRDQSQGRSVRLASLSLNHLLPSAALLTLAAHLHPNYGSPSGTYCGDKQDATHCACQIQCPKDGTCHGGGSSGPKSGDPVNLATGELEYTPENDLTVYNPYGPSITWSRIYNSLRAEREGGYQYNDYGQGWSQAYNVGIYDTTPGKTGTKYVFFPNGGRNSFTANAVPTAAAPAVQCAVQAGAAMLVEWDYSPIQPYGTFTITFPDRTKWVTTGYAATPHCFLLDQIQDRNGNAITFNYQQSVDGNGWPLLQSITDQVHAKTLLSITRANDGTGNIVSVSDAYGRSIYYHCGYYPTKNVPSGYTQSYQQLNHISEIVPAHTQSRPDRWAHGYSLVTNGEGSEQVPYLTGITAPSPTGTGTSTAIESYNPVTGTLASTTDANGNMHVYTPVNSSGQVSNSGAYTQVDYYDASGNLDYTYTVAFDNNMNETAVYTPATANMQQARFVNGRRSLRFGTLPTNNLGLGYTQSATTFSDPNDPYGPSSVTDANGHTTSATYDQFGNVLTATSARGTVTTNTISYANFALGELTKTVVGTKSPTSFTYFEPSGLLKSVTSPTPGTAGSTSTVTTSLTYDLTSQGTHGLGNVLTVTRPGNNAASSITTTYGYTSDGSYSQAAAIGQPLTETDALGHVTHLRYDAEANPLQMTDAVGNVTSLTYNIANQPLTTIYPATGQGGTGHAIDSSTYLYPAGPLTKTATTSENGTQLRETDYTYGPEGELLSRTGGSEPVAYTYNAEYKPASITDGNGKTTHYYYTPNGFVDTILYPGYTGAAYPDASGKDSVRFVTYDPLGDALVRIDGNGVETDFTYNDPENKLTNTHYPSKSSIDVMVGYDAYGRRNSMTDGSGSESYAYGDDDTLTKTITTYSGVSAQTISYTFNNDGSRKTMATPAGTFSYSYDSAGRMTQVKNPANETTAYGYGTNDWPSGETLANGVSAGYIYNARGFLTDLINKTSGGTTLSEFGGSTASTAMVYDGIGNRTQMNASVPAMTTYSGATSYTYDGKNQLTQEMSARDGSFTNGFAYDPAGNPTTFRSQGTNAFNADNQATVFKGSGGASLGTFTYDGNGNPTAYESKSLSFDPENRLTAYGTSLTAGYTGDDLRAWKSGSSGTKTYFLYDGTQEVIEFTSSGSVSAYNTFGPLGLVSRRTGSTSTFYAFDPQGNIAERSNSTGAIVNTDFFDAFGLAAVAPSDPFGYGAQWGYFTDAETGLVLCGHRYYDPAAGRWVTRDPIGYDGGINVYGYVENNAVTANDPDGDLSLRDGNVLYRYYRRYYKKDIDDLKELKEYTEEAAKVIKDPCHAGATIGKFAGEKIGEKIGEEIGAHLGKAYGGSVGGRIGFILGTPFGPFGEFIGTYLGTFIGNKYGEKIGGYLGGKVGGELGELAGEYAGEQFDKADECNPVGDFPEVDTPTV